MSRPLDAHAPSNGHQGGESGIPNWHTPYITFKRQFVYEKNDDKLFHKWVSSSSTAAAAPTEAK